MAVREWLERFREDVVTIDRPVSRELEVTRHLLAHPRQPVHFRDLDGYQAVGGLWSPPASRWMRSVSPVSAGVEARRSCAINCAVWRSSCVCTP